jgi:hypothetical protein
MYSVPPPGSGVIMAYILNILDLYNITKGDEGPLLYHRYSNSTYCTVLDCTTSPRGDEGPLLYHRYSTYCILYWTCTISPREKRAHCCTTGRTLNILYCTGPVQHQQGG